MTHGCRPVAAATRRALLNPNLPCPSTTAANHRCHLLANANRTPPLFLPSFLIICLRLPLFLPYQSCCLATFFSSAIAASSGHQPPLSPSLPSRLCRSQALLCHSRCLFFPLPQSPLSQPSPCHLLLLPLPSSVPSLETLLLPPLLPAPQPLSLTHHCSSCSNHITLPPLLSPLPQALPANHTPTVATLDLLLHPPLPRPPTPSLLLLPLLATYCLLPFLPYHNRFQPAFLTAVASRCHLLFNRSLSCLCHRLYPLATLIVPFAAATATTSALLIPLPR
ncbi:hypothetical protein GW17_00046527 [Ensete ventricosum]|nr:hypothetical protein GW17_00046527 [Ensete ventricosum]